MATPDPSTTRQLTDEVEQALVATREKPASTGRTLVEKALNLRALLLGQEVTVYPSYGYKDPQDPGQSRASSLIRWRERWPIPHRLLLRSFSKHC